tara:strand:- start:21 stop:494 length:474 start_codon:yes stop_codon:yes gene_type:complete
MLEAHHKMKLFFAVRPWENEPDHAEWVQEPSGYKCRIVRNEHTGTLCGYVGIPKEHRFWGIGYDPDSELSDISDNVHGGITYSQQGDDGWWYFGFDTSHLDDFAPTMIEQAIARHESNSRFYDCMKYKTWEFVDDQIYWLGKRLWQYNEYEKEDEDE